MYVNIITQKLQVTHLNYLILYCERLSINMNNTLLLFIEIAVDLISLGLFCPYKTCRWESQAPISRALSSDSSCKVNEIIQYIKGVWFICFFSHFCINVLNFMQTA